jgi:hypothetical protein
LQDHLNAVRRMTGRPPPELMPPTEPPAAIMYLWWWFHEVARGRRISAAGTLLPLAPSELHAWTTVRRLDLMDWEIDCLWQLDATFLKVMNGRGAE